MILRPANDDPLTDDLKKVFSGEVIVGATRSVCSLLALGRIRNLLRAEPHRNISRRLFVPDSMRSALPITLNNLRGSLQKVGLAISLFSMACAAQTPLPTEFDVATIRQHKEPSDSSRTNLHPGGRIEATNVTLLRMIIAAYDITEAQVIEPPAWVTDDRWDVEARADGFPSATTPEQVLPLLRKLLEDRFHLKVRVENRPMPVYRLSVAPGGPRLRPSKDTGNDSASTRSGVDKIRIEAQRMGTARLSQLLSRRLGRTVIDHTGLTGIYDFTLEWSPGLAVEAAVDAAGPSVFTALREQLGLRLEAAREEAPVLVIENAERPTEN